MNEFSTAPVQAIKPTPRAPLIFHLSNNVPKQPFVRLPQEQMRRHLAYLSHLTQHVKTVLPPDDWQVAGLTGPVLTIAAPNHTAAAQLRYLQRQYLAALNALPDFKQVQQIRVLVIPPVQLRTTQLPKLPPLTEDTRHYMQLVADQLSNAELSEAVRRLATPK